MTAQRTPAPLVPIPRRGLPGAPGILLHLLLTLTAVIPPLGWASLMGTALIPPIVTEGICCAALILLVLYLARATGKARGLVAITVTSALLLFFIFGSAVPAAMLLSMLFTVSLGGLLVAVADRAAAIRLPLIPLIAFLVSTVLCGSLQGGVISLLPFPTAVGLALGTRSSAAKSEGLTRVGVICLTSLLMGLSLISVAAYLFREATGTLSISSVTDHLDLIRQQMITLLQERADAVAASLTQPFTHDDVVNAVNGVFNLLPAFLVMSINFISAVAQMILLSSLHAFGFSESVTDRVRDFRISVISDGVFLLAGAVMLFSPTDTATMVGTVAENLFLILQPGLALAGLLRILYGMMRKGPRGGCAPILLLVIPVLFLILPSVLALYEGVAGIMSPILARLAPPTHPTDRGGNGGNAPYNDDSDSEDSDPPDDGGDRPV